MDFFERQDQARGKTRLLVFYFVVAVGLIIASVYFASLLIFHGATTHRRQGEVQIFTLWNPKLFLITAGGTLAVIAGGSLFKTAQLTRGGSAVAESLGGRPVESNTRDPDERKLLNVVEEMAIASGVPIPQVYVLEQESGINAFAAGHTPHDAAIGVTSGCIAKLKRDELQGVIGHEFSHILNGDMRLNLRLMGIIFGIVCLAVIGRVLLQTRGGGKEKNPLPLLGLVLLLLGWVGVFFAQLIQAAISRQREFLADASAVQFTRNPAGLSGALQKIGALPRGSRLDSGHAQEASHMFFGNALKSSLFNTFATHPPLEERIRAIDPHWDGEFPAQTGADAEDLEPVQRPANQSRPVFPPILPDFPHGAGGLVTAATAITAKSVLPHLGQPTPRHLRYAIELRESLPETIRATARNPHGAAALLYTLVLSEDESTRATQLAGLAQRASSAAYEPIAALWPEISPRARHARLPLVNLALPALRQLRADEFQNFNASLVWLIESDQQIVLFEFVLQKIIQRQIAPHFTRAPRPTTQYYSLKPLARDCAVLLSALAHTGQTEPAEVARAFQQGIPRAHAAGTLPTLLSRDECGLTEISHALDRLAQAVPQIKKNVLAACVDVAATDGMIQESEAELLRGIAETLDCPIPPFVAAA